MSWSPADDYDDQGNYCPGPTRTYPRFTRCAERCCAGTPLCRYHEGDTDDCPDDFRRQGAEDH